MVGTNTLPFNFIEHENITSFSLTSSMLITVIATFPSLSPVNNLVPFGVHCIVVTGVIWCDSTVHFKLTC